MNLEASLRTLRNALLAVLAGGLLVVFPVFLSLWGIRSLAQPWALVMPLAVWIVTLAVWWRVFTVLLPDLWREGVTRGGVAGGARRKRYLQIRDSQVAAYQTVFDQLVACTDAENLRRVRNGEPHLPDVLAEDLRSIDAAAAKAAAAGMNPDYVRTIFEQWVWADPLKRASVRANWVATVRRRCRNDFFPSARVVAERRELWARGERADAAGVPLSRAR